MNKNIFRGFIIFAALALFVSACKKEEAAQQQSQARKQPAQQLSSPQQCLAESVFGADSFKNDCIGLKFAGGQPFLYGAQKIYGQTISFAVPGGGYSVKIVIFENPSDGLNDEISQVNFSKGMKAHLSETPGTSVIQENIMQINNIPVLYLETVNGPNIARNYFFHNRGRWVQLTLSFTKESFTRNPRAQDQLIKSIVLY